MTTARLILGMSALVLVGAPMVWFLWEVLNDLLQGIVDGPRVLIALPVLLAFLALLDFVARTVRRWEGTATE